MADGYSFFDPTFGLIQLPDVGQLLAMQAASQQAAQPASAAAKTGPSTIPAAPDTGKTGASTIPAAPETAPSTAPTPAQIAAAQQAAQNSVSPLQGSGNPLFDLPVQGDLVKDPTQKWNAGGVPGAKTIEVGPNSLPGLPLETEDPGGYYAAKTNVGDKAATVMAQPGAKVRLIDPGSGQVVAEGVGPEGSQYIASLASAVSQKLGKQAQWDIAVETGAGSGKYSTMQGDRIDKPRFTLLSALKMAAPAIIGAIAPELLPAIAPGLSGASLAAASGGLAGLTGLATGQSPLQALLSGVGAGIGAGFSGAGGGAGAAGGAGGGLNSTFAEGLGNAVGGIPTSGIDFGAATAGLAGSPGVFSSGLDAALGLSGAAAGALGGAVDFANFGNTTAAGGLPHINPNTGESTEIEVTAGAAPGAGGLGLGVGAGLGAAAGGIPHINPNTGESDPIEVDAHPKTAPSNPTADPADILTTVPGLIPSPNGTLQGPQQGQGQNNDGERRLVQDVLKHVLQGGGGGGSGGPPGGSEGGRSSVSDPFTPGGGSRGPQAKPGTTPTQTPGETGGSPFSTPSTSTPSFRSSSTTPTGSTGSPFGGGGSGPGALGDINLKGSAAPDIYPWSTVV